VAGTLIAAARLADGCSGAGLSLKPARSQQGPHPTRSGGSWLRRSLAGQRRPRNSRAGRWATSVSSAQSVQSELGQVSQTVAKIWPALPNQAGGRASLAGASSSPRVVWRAHTATGRIAHRGRPVGCSGPPHRRAPGGRAAPAVSAAGAGRLAARYSLRPGATTMSSRTCHTVDTSPLASFAAAWAF
jgi:hypothetical protein